MNMTEVCLSWRAAIAEVWKNYHEGNDLAVKIYDRVLAKTKSKGKALKAMFAQQKKARDRWTVELVAAWEKHQPLFAAAPSGVR